MLDKQFDIFCSRLNNYKSNDRKYLVGEICMQEHIFREYLEYLENVSNTIIDKTDSQSPEKRENYWIHTLKAMVPWGLNILSCVNNV